jgi:hypothetical protein
MLHPNKTQVFSEMIKCVIPNFLCVLYGMPAFKVRENAGTRKKSCQVKEVNLTLELYEGL